MHTLTAEPTTVEIPDAPETLALERAGNGAQLHPRVNIPIDLENWKHLPEEIQTELAWFHQHILDLGLTNDQSAKALGLSYTVVFQALKGNYKGSLENVADRIRSYRRIWRERSKIQNVEFVPNRNTKLIFDGLDYAVASNTITLILGETGMSKSMAVEQWRNNNNSGRTILINAPDQCTRTTLLTELCQAVGHKPGTCTAMRDKIRKALNKGRTLIVDEALFLFGGLGGRNRNPACLETLRRLHDDTKCGLALVATARFGEDLRHTHYQFEQLLGRIGMPVRLFRTLRRADVEPIIEQYFTTATDYLIRESLAIANAEHPLLDGRLRTLVEIFRHASRISSKERGQRKMSERHFLDALAVREKMMGDTTFAKH